MKTRIHHVKEKYRDKLLQMPNVVGVGVGKKVIGGKRTDIDAVIVLVKEKIPEKQLKPEAIIPRELEGIPTDVMGVGEVKTLQPVKTILILVEEDRTRRFEKIPVGVSIGNELITSGTSNVLIEDEEGELCTTSNAHVLTSYLATCKKPSKGEKIYQPGPYFGGTPNENLCAKLKGWEPIAPKALDGDYAWANTKDGEIVEREWSQMIYGLGIPVRAVMRYEDLRGNEEVVSDGLNGTFYGRILGLHFDVKVNYGCEVKLVKDTIVTTYVGRPGSSGSPLLLATNPSILVGYLFAGSNEITVHTSASKMYDKHGHKLYVVSFKYKPARVVLDLKVVPPGMHEVVLEAQLDKDEYESGDTATVAGDLKEKDTGDPIPSAPIFFYLDGKKLGQTTTNLDGRFEFKFIVPYVEEEKTFKLTVEFPGM